MDAPNFIIHTWRDPEVCANGFQVGGQTVWTSDDPKTGEEVQRQMRAAFALYAQEREDCGCVTCYKELGLKHGRRG